MLMIIITTSTTTSTIIIIIIIIFSIFIGVEYQLNITWAMISRLLLKDLFCWLVGFWRTRQTEDTDSDPETHVKTTLRELLIYLVFITILCICESIDSSSWVSPISSGESPLLHVIDSLIKSLLLLLFFNYYYYYCYYYYYYHCYYYSSLYYYYYSHKFFLWNSIKFRWKEWWPQT